MHAEKCPVCGGSGKIEDNKCHGCNGLGWVEVHDFWPVNIPRPCIVYQPYQPDYDPYPGNVWCADGTENQWSDNVAWHQAKPF